MIATETPTDIKNILLGKASSEGKVPRARCSLLWGLRLHRQCCAASGLTRVGLRSRHCAQDRISSALFLRGVRTEMPDAWSFPVADTEQPRLGDFIEERD